MHCVHKSGSIEGDMWYRSHVRSVQCVKFESLVVNKCAEIILGDQPCRC
jgi:hypothetical protein